MAEEKKSPGVTGAPAASPVGSGHAGNPPAVAPAASSAVVSVPKYGGNRSGKKRADGLAPGSPEAKEADKKKDAVRKREERKEERRLAEPPPLPSALPPAGGQPGAPLSPQDPNGAPLGGQAGPGPAAPAAIPWEPGMVKEFTDEIVNATEAWRQSKNVALAREAGLPDSLVKRISADSQFQPGAKRTLQLATPRVACKWLNKAGVSAEYADEVALLTAMGALLLQGRKTTALLEDLIEQNRKLIEKQNAQKKPDQTP